jgi:hypothetical protein
MRILVLVLNLDFEGSVVVVYDFLNMLLREPLTEGSYELPHH